MHNLGLYTGPYTRLVVALDIGATFSGVSYCILEPGQILEVFGVTEFPAQGVRGDAKVPSLLYYDRNGDVKAAGAEVLAESIVEVALTEGWTRAEWWKLHLRPKHLASSINLDDDLPPLPPGKSVVDVLTDFIKYLFKCAKIYIQGRHLAFDWSSMEDSIEYVFTCPNGWEGVQQVYRRAIARAGLIPTTPEGESRVHMLTDGEASLRFCISNLLSVEAADEAAPRGIAVIDAGGATISLSVYSMTFNPFFWEEVAPAECRLQGSVFVTRRARILLQRRLEGWEHSSLEDIAEYIREFDRSTKFIIKSDQEPAYVRVAGLRVRIAKYNITFGKLKLSGEEATGLFNDSIDAIIGAFEQQQKSVTTQISTALLVGGFSTNDWVWSRLRSYFKAKNINICRPDNHMNKAVANGAVLSYIDRGDYHYLVASQASVVCLLPANANDKKHTHRKGQWEIDPDCYAAEYSESNFHQMACRQSFSLTRSSPADFGMQTVRIEYYRGNMSNSERAKRDQSSYSTLFTISADLSEAVEDLIVKKAAGEVYYQLDYDVILLFGFATLQAQVGWKTRGGERRIPATVSYDS